ncbi:amidohydrolase family protein [Polycyclovorans algicola]|uniref:amidohydrolase family protein n=1 Tax=Polycyclovorans algicola TaxID=616992 RepID=UPI000694E784|nr:amidohydrolase family protein [Polycyclovorans algicola]
MLIRNATGLDGVAFDLRIDAGRIAALDTHLPARDGESEIDARGNALLPGLNDHHLHLLASATAQHSVHCGPPQIDGPRALATALNAAARHGQWLRGVGWHESVMGDDAPLDRDWLDRHGPAVPVRIQHRSGRLWVLNSLALDALGPLGENAPFQQVRGRCTGHLLDGDTWLRQRVPSQRPSVAALSQQLAGYGVVGFTDATPDNDRDAAHAFALMHAAGDLRQRVRLMGNATLDGLPATALLHVGEAKVHLLEGALPDFDTLVTQIRTRQHAGRATALHCTSRVELVFALTALNAAATSSAHRIEHAGVCPPELLEAMRHLGLTVVSQPHFIAEKGDRYRLEVDTDDQPWLYRLGGFCNADIALAAGSDAPFGGLNPWAAMQAAVDRRDRHGEVLGAAEALTPEAALGLFTGTLDAPGVPRFDLAPGEIADLCLIDRPWRQARADLRAARVLGVWRAGVEIFGAAAVNG